MGFQLVSDFKPTGDQPQAVASILESFRNKERYVTLQGVTGSGKTFTMANAVNELERPTLVLAHNKPLAAQLYSEFKQFFPNNAIEYFVYYYDYYRLLSSFMECNYKRFFTWFFKTRGKFYSSRSLIFFL